MSVCETEMLNTNKPRGLIKRSSNYDYEQWKSECGSDDNEQNVKDFYNRNNGKNLNKRKSSFKSETENYRKSP